MKDPQFQAIWHALNEANVCLVLASRENVLKKRREMMVAALEENRKATVMLLDVLSEREERNEFRAP